MGKKGKRKRKKTFINLVNLISVNQEREPMWWACGLWPPTKAHPKNEEKHFFWGGGLHFLILK